MRALSNLIIFGLRLAKDKSGSVAAEYSFVIVFVAILAAVGFGVLGDGLTTYFDGLSRPVEAATNDIQNPLGGGGSSGGGNNGGGNK